MRRGLAVASACLLLGAVCFAADELSVTVDPRADFSLFKTFSLREGKIDSPRPELDNRLFVKKLSATIRAALVSRGLKESADRPDLVVDYVVIGEDINTTQRGMVRGAGPQPLRFTEATLVIDLTRPGDTAPVWRGTYRDDEKTGSKLVEKLPEDAKKLIDKYPRRK